MPLFFSILADVYCSMVFRAVSFCVAVAVGSIAGWITPTPIAFQGDYPGWDAFSRGFFYYYAFLFLPFIIILRADSVGWCTGMLTLGFMLSFLGSLALSYTFY